jgi:hypothetical protein
LNPILEEYADALFQTLRVKPLQLAESAVSDVVIAQAISPEVLERMKALNDPEVQKVLADFKANVKKAVQQSGEMLQNGLGDNIGNLLGNAVRQFMNSIKYTVADIPGIGAGMAVVAGLDAVLDAAKQAKVIEGEVVNALKPLNAVQAQVSAVTDAVNKATSNLPLGSGQVGDVEMTGLGPDAASETTDESAPALRKRTEPARQVVGTQDDTFATPVSENEKVKAAMESDENSRLGGGGSRKRRRIHKLSRRIERTLRRVQKKYGLQNNQGDQNNQGNQDKNGFLRRTLRHRKH